MTTTGNVQPKIAGPPSRHQLALMIWLCVFPTLTVINLLLGSWLGTLSPVVRTFVLATIAVPIVIYGQMPHVQRLRQRLIARRRQPEITDRGCGCHPRAAWRERAGGGRRGCED